MKRNIISGIILIGALALSSCSTTRLASNQADKDDDVYFSHAKAGDAPDYVYNAPQENTYNNNNDDDYYYYNSYTSRINRFDYLSPFGYYNDFYDGYYSPYYGGYNSYSAGIGVGMGYGAGYYGFGGLGFTSLYSPFGYYNGYSLGYGYAYYPYIYGGYSPYSYLGTGYYGGGGGYWGVYSASSNKARPYRGSGAPNAMVSRSINPIGYSGNYPVNTNYPGRPSVNSSGNRQAINSTNNNNNNNSRPVRNDQPSRQVYQPQSTPVTNSSSGSSSSGSSSGGGSSSSGSSGGGRPVRP